MKDVNLDGLNNIKANKELIESTVNKIMNKNKSKNYFNAKKYVAVAASLMVIVGAASFYALHTKEGLGKGIDNKTVADKNALPNKSAVNSNAIPNKTVVDNNIAPSKTTLDNITPNKIVVGNNVLSNKAVANNNMPSNKVLENNNGTSNKAVLDSPGIIIPAISLNPSNGTHAKMFALVVYNGKIYIESNTQLNLKNTKNLLGKKIGSTINSINEWNVKDKSSEELASNIGEQDIYTVKGYDDSFRIMSYSKIESGEYAQFFDCLNGITIKSGKDIFGKLNLVNNIESAKFTIFDDWNNGISNYTNFENVNLLNEVSKELNNTAPYNYETVEKDIDSSRNNNDFREFTLKLRDGSELKFTAFKKGYVSYGYSNIYFKVENSVINKLWQ